MNDPVSSKRLWQTVIVLAIRDLCNPHPGKTRDRQSAELWVGTFPSADFREVCQLAGLEARRAHTALSHLCRLAPESRLALLEAQAPSTRSKRAA
jgi:hypothetical protein